MKEQINQIKTTLSMSGSIKNEEATKIALILPMLKALGWDVYNPNEVTPEQTNRFGKRVDLVLKTEGKEIMLVECKSIHENLTNHNEQLYDYFTKSDAKVAVLTNGVKYWFYTDSVSVNLMDREPFLRIDINSLSDSDIEWLTLLSKESFNYDTIIKKVRYSNLCHMVDKTVTEALHNITDEFIALIVKKLNNGRCNKSLMNQYRPIVKACVINAMESKSERVNPEKLLTNTGNSKLESDVLNQIVIFIKKETDNANDIRVTTGRYYNSGQTYHEVSFGSGSSKCWIVRVANYGNAGSVHVRIKTGGKKTSEGYNISSVSEIEKIRQRISEAVKTAYKSYTGITE